MTLQTNFSGAHSGAGLQTSRPGSRQRGARLDEGSVNALGGNPPAFMGRSFSIVAAWRGLFRNQEFDAG